MFFKRLRRDSYRCGVSTSLHLDFGLPEREADELTGAGRARRSHKNINQEFFNHAHKAGWTCWRTAYAIVDSALKDEGVDTEGGRRNLIAIRLGAAAKGKGNMTLFGEKSASDVEAPLR